MSETENAIESIQTTTRSSTSMEFGPNGTILKTWDDAGRLAKMFSMSGYFKDVRDVAQAMVKLQYGAELGFTPMASMMNIYIVDGKPSLSGAGIAARIKRSGAYRYTVKSWNGDECRLQWFEKEPDGKWFDLGESSFTIEDAKQAELIGRGVWKKYTKSMLMWRALTQGARLFCPELFLGSIYTVEELEDEIEIDQTKVKVSEAAQSPTVQPEPKVEQKPKRQTKPAQTVVTDAQVISNPLNNVTKIDAVQKEMPESQKELQKEEPEPSLHNKEIEGDSDEVDDAREQFEAKRKDQIEGFNSMNHDEKFLELLGLNKERVWLPEAIRICNISDKKVMLDFFNEAMSKYNATQVETHIARVFMRYTINHKENKPEWSMLDEKSDKVIVEAIKLLRSGKFI